MPYLTGLLFLMLSALTCLGQDLGGQMQTKSDTLATKTAHFKLTDIDYSRSAIGRFFWGKHYRDAYQLKLSAPIFLLDTSYSVIRRGGGQQTNSLRLLQRSTGREFTLRSLEKDATRTLPYPYQSEWLADLLQDNYSAAHPLSTTLASSLAQEAGLYHTNPHLVFLPIQYALDSFNTVFAEHLYYMEARPDGIHWQDVGHLGNPDNIIGTEKLVEKRLEDHRNTLDEGQLLRSRLFDIWIGDWDRHDDQWRWGASTDGHYTKYFPIPRDRDQAFANYDGLMLAVARRLSPKSRQWRPFTGRFGRVQWSQYNAAYFDRSFLSGAPLSAWNKLAQALQHSLTDTVILQTLRDAAPQYGASLEIEQIAKVLQKRRDGLQQVAWKYYRFLAKSVQITGTSEDNRFEISTLANGSLSIKVFTAGQLHYSRIFYKEETQQIQCYGLDGRDTFIIQSAAATPIHAHLVGGGGDDFYHQSSTNNGSLRHISLLDSAYTVQDDNSKLAQRANKVLLPSTYNYDPSRPLDNYHFHLAVPSLRYNPDDRLLIGWRGTYTRYSYPHLPNAATYQYHIQGSTASNGIRAAIEANWSSRFVPWRWTARALWQSPLYTTGFYGLGNNSVSQEPERGVRFHRIRTRQQAVYAGLLAPIAKNAIVELQSGYHRYELVLSSGTFLDSIARIDQKNYDEPLPLWNSTASWTWQKNDGEVFPIKGMAVKLALGYAHALTSEAADFSKLQLEWLSKLPLVRSGHLVWALRTGIDHRLHGNYPFYLGAALGGQDDVGNLRGFRRGRFTGQSAFYVNQDLRWLLGRWNNRFIPGEIGLTTSLDLGKVAVPDEASSTLHYSYGGGLFFMPFSAAVVHLGLYQAEQEDWRFTFTSGFFF